MIQKKFRMIGCIGAVHYYRNSFGFCYFSDMPRNFTHPTQAHLRQKVEVILVNRHDARVAFGEECGELLFRITQHRIEESNREPSRTESGCRV